MNSLHISLTEFRNESRLLKETTSLLSAGYFKKIFVAALHAEDLGECESNVENLNVKRFKLRSKKLGKSLAFQIPKYIEFCYLIFMYYRKMNIYVVNIHTLGLLPLGLFLKYTFGAKLVYDTHELETEKNGLHGLRKWISKWLERTFIKYVDMTIVVSDSIADWYAREYDMQRPVVVLNAPRTRALRTNDHFREKLGIRRDQMILLYQGGLKRGRGVHLVMNAFKERSDDNVVVVFMGYGELKEDIKQAAQQWENIYFYPAVPPSIVLEYTASADFGIHLIQNTCLNHDFCMPNKLFEYAMAGLPVLVSPMKDMSELVLENRMGVVTKDFSAAGINRAIDDLVQQDISGMKNNAYRAACENAWEVQEKKMLAAYDALLIGK